MKILFLGDASNYSRTLADALLRMGHDVVVASHGSGWMNTKRDIDLRRDEGLAGTLSFAARIVRALPQLRGYDVVQLHNPSFVNLRVEKLKPIFRYLAANNKKIALTALGSDCNYVKACISRGLFRYSDYRIGDLLSPFTISNPDNEKNWTTQSMRAYTDYITQNVDGVIACLYEYYKTYEGLIPKNKLYSCGIPIEISSVKERLIESEPEKVKFFIGIQRDRSILKGTDIMLEALKRVVADYPDKCEMCVAENLPYNQYVEKFSQSHVLLDQLYSYTPATNALLAMARGMIAVSGAEPEYYDFVGETENHPIINVSPLEPDDVYNKLVDIVKNKARLPELSHRSREFVIKHNDSEKVAKQYLEFWQNI